MEQEAAEKRQKATQFGGDGKFPGPPTGEVRDKIGEFAGVSGRTVDKIRDVVDASEKDPERFGHLVDEMDRTGKVSGAHRKLKMARDEDRVFGIKPVPGKFHTLVIDPPWDYEWLSLPGRAMPFEIPPSARCGLFLGMPVAACQGVPEARWPSWSRQTREGPKAHQ